MTKWLRLIPVSLAVLAPMAVSADADARPRGHPPDLIGPLPPLDAAGCYYYRGREWCGRYCYYEVNGKRYCQRWKRDAHPQAEVEVEYLEPRLK
ncbi:MAG: hypothetical protein ACT4N2_06345 [Hyphomicrobium sp.]